MKAMMFALTKVGILPSNHFMKQQEEIKAKKEVAKKAKEEKRKAEQKAFAEAMGSYSI